ncbi:hypothetical protein Droror1_Dr00026779 [Drosera rotundifolia]
MLFASHVTQSSSLSFIKRTPKLKPRTTHTNTQTLSIKELCSVFTNFKQTTLLHFLIFSKVQPIMAISNTQQQQQRPLSSRSIRRHFHWATTSNKVSSSQEADDDDDLIFITGIRSNNNVVIVSHKRNPSQESQPPPQSSSPNTKSKKNRAVSLAVVKLRRAISTSLRQNKNHHQEQRLGHKVIGTLFGHRRGTVNFVLQKEHNTSPVLFLELATPITTLVTEMATGGLVRIALECTKSSDTNQKPLLGESSWRAYCNGKQCGYAKRKEMGAAEAKILKMVEPISMGAGVLAGFNGSGCGGDRGELMYVRAKFERVVGSRDSEAFYMMNPDSNCAPELSVYLLRV